MSASTRHLQNVDMFEDISPKFDGYALYLPAIQEYVAKQLLATSSPPRTPMPSGLKATDFDWLDQENDHWRYRYCLASAGHYAESGQANLITERHPASFVLGDSGGFQIATGALKSTKSWVQYQHDPSLLKQLWLDGQSRHCVKGWLDANCDYAMTIDFPLWLREQKHRATPFHKLSEADLIELTVSNLELISGHRIGDCKYLNVLQASGADNDSLGSEDRWFDAVKDFPFEGWSFGGDVGVNGGIYRILRRLLLLRDLGLLEPPRNWLHLLGVSTPIWAVCLSAIQRSIRKSINENFRVSFDSASAYQAGGRQSQYYSMPHLGPALNGWVLRPSQLPTGYGYAISSSNEQVLDSPLGRLFGVRDLNPRAGRFEIKSTDTLSDAVLVNHNVYILLKSMIAANEAIFVQGIGPPELLAAVDQIDRLFQIKDWHNELEDCADQLAMPFV